MNRKELHEQIGSEVIELMENVMKADFGPGFVVEDASLEFSLGTWPDPNMPVLEGNWTVTVKRREL